MDLETRGGRVLVTGGAGFIGSHVVGLLVDRGLSVRVLDLPGACVDHLPKKGVEFAAGDLRDPDFVRRAARGCDVVLHLAANPNLWARDPKVFEQVNHQGARNVLAAALEAGAARVVHVSTESILTSQQGRETIDDRTHTGLKDQLGPYCRSKWLAEEAAGEFAARGLAVSIASPTVPVGPGDVHLGPLTRMIRAFSRGRIRAYLDADINLIDVRDAALGVLACAERGEPGRRYLLAGENWSLPDIFRELARLTGRPAPTRRAPYALALAFAWLEQAVCRLSGGTPMATVTGVRLTRRNFRFDGRASLKALGLVPRPCAPALAETVDWLRARGLG
ncbi:MAG: NAD-dependent epimerase/dehydratase family protein [Desulfovibrionaceae bacterium]|nr:NAD-dependent epimerase/dehydratase family protein [Desulfovibrionaceae bacterium]